MNGAEMAYWGLWKLKSEDLVWKIEGKTIKLLKTTVAFSYLGSGLSTKIILLLDLTRVFNILSEINLRQTCLGQGPVLV
jgi:hypothetical protein